LAIFVFVYVFFKVRIILFTLRFVITSSSLIMAQEAETCSKYLCSLNKRSLHHFWYTDLHCLYNTPTYFGALRRHLQEAHLNC